MAGVECGSVHDVVFFCIPALCFYIDDDLGQAVAHSYVKDNVKTDQPLIQFLVFCIQADDAFSNCCFRLDDV